MQRIFSRYVAPIARQIFGDTEAAAPKVLQRFSTPATSKVSPAILNRPKTIPSQHPIAYRPAGPTLYPAFRLSGTPHADRLYGLTLLNSMISRNISTLAREASTHSAQTAASGASLESCSKPMMEPYRSILNAMKSRFEKNGFVQCEESEYAITFSNGKLKIDISADRYDHGSVNIAFVDTQKNVRSFRIVMDRLEPGIREKNDQAFRKLVQQYLHSKEGLSGHFTKACIELEMQQLIEFVEKYDKELAAL